MPLSPIIGVSVTGTDQGGYGRINFSGSSVTGSQNGDTYSIRLRDFNRAEDIVAENITGFRDRTSSAITWVDGTRTLSVAPSGTSSFDVFVNDQKFTFSTTQSFAITNTIGEHFIYFNASGTITGSTSPWTISSDQIAPLATVYWDGNDGAVGDERHSAWRNRIQHSYLHNTRGTAYDSGLSGSFGSASFSIDSGVIWDEDIRFALSAQTVARIWYRSGSVMLHTTGTTPYLSISGNLQYDNAGTLTPVGSNNYVVSWIYATNEYAYPVYVVLGQNAYSNIAGAEGDTSPVFPNIATREWKLIYAVVYRNTATPTFIEALDYRSVSNLPNNSAVSSLPASAVVFTPGGTITSTNVQSALDELDTLKVAKAGDLMTGALTGTAVSMSNNITIKATGSRQALTIGLLTDVSSSAPDAIDLGGSWSSTAGQNLKLKLYNTGANYAGFGGSTNAIDYVTSFDGVHKFFTNGSTRVQLNSTGVSIGTNLAPRTNTKLTIGATSSLSTATPDIIDLGGTFADTTGTGTKLKIKVYNDNSVQFGIGAATNQLEYIVGATHDHAWYASTNRTMKLSPSSLTLYVPITGTSISGTSGLLTSLAVNGLVTVTGGLVATTSIATDSLTGRTTTPLTLTSYASNAQGTGTIINTGNNFTSGQTKLISIQNSGSEVLHITNVGSVIASSSLYAGGTGALGSLYALTASSLGNNPFNIRGTPTSNGSAIAVVINTSTALTASGDKLLSIQNSGTEKFSVDRNGSAVGADITANSALNSQYAYIDQAIFAGYYGPRNSAQVVINGGYLNISGAVGCEIQNGNALTSSATQRILNLKNDGAVKAYFDASGNLSVPSLLGSPVTVSNISASGTPSSTTYLRGDGVWAAASGGGGGTPGGSNTQVQFNDSGSFGGSSGLTFNKNTGVLSAQTASFSMMSASNAFISSTIYTDDTIDVKAPTGSNSAIIQFPSIRQYDSTGTFTNNTSGLAIYEKSGADCANFLLIGSTVETGEPGKLGSMSGTFTYGEQYVTTNTGYRLRVLSAISGVTAGDIEYQMHVSPGYPTEIISVSGTEFRQQVAVTGNLYVSENGQPYFAKFDSTATSQSLIMSPNAGASGDIIRINAFSNGSGSYDGANYSIYRGANRVAELHANDTVTDINLDFWDPTETTVTRTTLKSDINRTTLSSSAEILLLPAESTPGQFRTVSIGPRVNVGGATGTRGDTIELRFRNWNDDGGGTNSYVHLVSRTDIPSGNGQLGVSFGNDDKFRWSQEYNGVDENYMFALGTFADNIPTSLDKSGSFYLGSESTGTLVVNTTDPLAVIDFRSSGSTFLRFDSANNGASIKAIGNDLNLWSEQNYIEIGPPNGASSPGPDSAQNLSFRMFGETGNSAQAGEMQVAWTDYPSSSYSQFNFSTVGGAQFALANDLSNLPNYGASYLYFGGSYTTKIGYEPVSGTLELSSSTGISISGSVKATSDIEITGSVNGLILSSPDGTRWRLTVNNSGSVVATSL